jgi:hypothetical protein
LLISELIIFIIFVERRDIKYTEKKVIKKDERINENETISAVKT